MLCVCVWTRLSRTYRNLSNIQSLFSLFPCLKFFRSKRELVFFMIIYTRIQTLVPVASYLLLWSYIGFSSYSLQGVKLETLIKSFSFLALFFIFTRGRRDWCPLNSTSLRYITQTLADVIIGFVTQPSLPITPPTTPPSPMSHKSQQRLCLLFGFWPLYHLDPSTTL